MSKKGVEEGREDGREGNFWVGGAFKWGGWGREDFITFSRGNISRGVAKEGSTAGVQGARWSTGLKGRHLYKDERSKDRRGLFFSHEFNTETRAGKSLDCARMTASSSWPPWSTLNLLDLP